MKWLGCILLLGASITAGEWWYLQQRKKCMLFNECAQLFTQALEYVRTSQGDKLHFFALLPTATPLQKALRAFAKDPETARLALAQLQQEQRTQYPSEVSLLDEAFAAQEVAQTMEILSKGLAACTVDTDTLHKRAKGIRSLIICAGALLVILLF